MTEDLIISEIRRDQARMAARKMNPRAQGLVEGHLYRHKKSEGRYVISKLTNLTTEKPGWDVQVCYYPLGDMHTDYSRPITEFLEKFELIR